MARFSEKRSQARVRYQRIHGRGDESGENRPILREGGERAAGIGKEEEV